MNSRKFLFPVLVGVTALSLVGAATSAWYFSSDKTTSDFTSLSIEVAPSTIVVEGDEDGGKLEIPSNEQGDLDSLHIIFDQNGAFFSNPISFKITFEDQKPTSTSDWKRKGLVAFNYSLKLSPELGKIVYPANYVTRSSDYSTYEGTIAVRQWQEEDYTDGYGKKKELFYISLIYYQDINSASTYTALQQAINSSNSASITISAKHMEG